MPCSPPASCPGSTPTLTLPAGHFLSIPGELRNQIYHYHLHLEGGYVYNFHTRSVSAAHPDERLHLGLQFTCTRVYTEMRGLALTTNAIHFYPAEPPELRTTAARFQALCWLLDRRLNELVWPRYLFQLLPHSLAPPILARQDFEAQVVRKRRAGYEVDNHPEGEDASWVEYSDHGNEHKDNTEYVWRHFRENPKTMDRRKDPEVSLDPCEVPLVNEAIVDEVVLTYPEMRHLLFHEPIHDTARTGEQGWQERHIYDLARMWGTGHIADSRLQKAAIHTVQVAIKQGHFTGSVAAYASTILRLVSALRPWAIPSAVEIDKVVEELRACGALNPYDYEFGPWGQEYWKGPGFLPLVDEAKADVCGWGRKNFFAKRRLSAAASSCTRTKRPLLLLNAMVWAWFHSVRRIRSSESNAELLYGETSCCSPAKPTTTTMALAT